MSGMHAAAARVRTDGTESGRVETTFLVTGDLAGRRPSALLVHSGT